MLFFRLIQLYYKKMIELYHMIYRNMSEFYHTFCIKMSEFNYNPYKKNEGITTGTVLLPSKTVPTVYYFLILSVVFRS